MSNADDKPRTCLDCKHNPFCAHFKAIESANLYNISPLSSEVDLQYAVIILVAGDCKFYVQGGNGG